MINKWLSEHVAVMGQCTGVKGFDLPIRALRMIDSGGLDGVPMSRVHKALMGARLAPGVIRLIIDRLVAEGHVHRVEIPTAGRRRIQMWSFRTIAADPEKCELALDLAQRGRDGPVGLLRWEGKTRQKLCQEVVQAAGGDLSIKDIEVGAFQIYSDIDGRGSALLTTLFNSETKARIAAFLNGMAMSGYLGNAGEVAGVRRWFMGCKIVPASYQDD